MNKKVGIFLILGLLVLSMSFASIGWFSDIWGKITGKTIDNGLPIGFLDFSNSSHVLGWACDPNTPEKSINVHVYFGGSNEESSSVAYLVVANLSSEDEINSACGGGTKHRFSFIIPEYVLNRFGGGPYRVYAYGINTGSGNNFLLSGSPQWIGSTDFGIMYSTWHCPMTEYAVQGPYPIFDLSEILAGRQDFGGNGIHHWIDESTYGYYCLSQQPYILRSHAKFFIDAGIDFIYIDATNHDRIDQNLAQEMILTPFETLLEEWKNIPNAPKVVVWLPIKQPDRNSDDPTGSKDTITWLLNFIQTHPEYDSLWYKYEGRILILATDSVWQPAYQPSISNIENNYEGKFVVKKMWTSTSANPTSQWSFFEECSDFSTFKSSSGTTTCNQKIYSNNGVPEYISVAAAYSQGCMNNFANTIPKFKGRTFRQQFQTVFQNFGVPVVAFPSWNEWVTLKTYNPAGVYSPSDGNNVCFTDNYNLEYSRDIEAGKNEMGYFYYNLMKDCISLYKSGNNCNSANMGSRLCCRDINESAGSRDKIGCNYNGFCDDYEDIVSCAEDCLIILSCNSFTYSPWSTCNSSALQSRTITSQSPSGCTGGNPESLIRQCSPPCLESNWQNFLSPSICPSSGQQTKDWERIGTCNETIGINHSSSETISCTYIPPQCVEGDWTSLVSPTLCPISKQQTKTWTKSPSCSGGITHPSSETISCTYNAPICTSFDYSEWTNCSESNKQSRTILTYIPENCQAGNPILSRNCTYGFPECNFTYSNWSECLSNGIQSRTLISVIPESCTSSNPELVRECHYVAPNTGKKGTGGNSGSNSPSNTIKHTQEESVKENNTDIKILNPIDAEEYRPTSVSLIKQFFCRFFNLFREDRDC